MIVILTGAPGAGKGTQANLLSSQLGYHKISTGDVLRKHIKERTPIGELVEAMMAEGRLVPDEVLAGIVGEEIAQNRGKKILLDGYPRTRTQAETLENILAPNRVDTVVLLDVDPAALVERISGRRTCSGCGVSFHVNSAPPKVEGRCDSCGAALSQRPDDDEAKVRVRLDIYERETKPVLDFYATKGIFTRVDGNRSTEEVFRDLESLLSR